MTHATAASTGSPRRLTERQSLAIVGAGHVVVLAALSLALRSVTPPPSAVDAVAVEVVADAPAGAPPAPAPAHAAPPAPTPPVEAPPPEPKEKPEVKPDPPKPEVIPDPPKPEVKPDPAPARIKPDRPKPEPTDKPAQAKPKTKPKPLDTDALSSLLDRRLPRAKAKPLDTAALAKSLDAAVPKTKALDTAALSTSLDAALHKSAPKASRGDPHAAAAIAAAIRAQVTPCWTLPIGGTGKMTVVLAITINRDGSVAGRPGVVGQTGVTSSNADYARAFAEAARRAVLRCAPLKLPADQYDQWKAVEINFDPSTL